MIESEEMTSQQQYRLNVGIMIVNREQKILAGDASHYPGEWMMPQGGIDHAESAREAMQRELYEETGLKTQQVRLIREHDEWLQYRYIYRVPLAILASGLALAAGLAFALGLILDSIVYQHRMNFEREMTRSPQE